MLGTLIEKLSALLSKGAFVASFIPLLAFVAANFALLAVIHLPSRLWFLRHKTDAEFISAAVLAFLIAALIFATINTWLRELMEGRFWPARICGALIKGQRDRLQVLTDENRRLQRNVRGMRRAPRWTKDLKDARETYPKTADLVYNRDGPAGSLIRDLTERKKRGELIEPETLARAVDQLTSELRITPMSPELDADQVELNDIIRFSLMKNRSEFVRVFKQRQFNFPDDEIDPVAPTAMGNIAFSIRSYARSRYRVDIETFWTRLQKVMQGEPFYAVLQDAKVQLDFLVSLFWLSLVSTAAWLIALATLGYSLWLYLAIAIAGPLAVWTEYWLALQNYRGFADLMRSSVDMYRMRLLKELNLSEPSGSREEALLWDALLDRMAYGKDFYLSYRRSE